MNNINLVRMLLPIQYFNSQISATNLLQYFLLLDGSNFVLLDDTDFLLLSVGFAPVNYASTILWLDGNDPLANNSTPTNNSLVSLWCDKSQNALTFTQTASGNKPQNKNNFINGKNVIYFGNNTTSYLTSDQSLTLGSSNSISMVFQAPTSTAHWVFDCATSPELYVRFVVPGYVQVGFNIGGSDVGMISAQVTPGVNYIMTFVFNASGTSNIFLNGVLQTGSSFSVTSGANATNVRIGASSDLSQSFDGYVGEIILANISWTNTIRNQMESYLSSKWGVAI